jgi:GDP-4-dehydro-6-deoxy-D-mannose reductase
VRAYWLIINRGEPGQVYNVGSGRAIAIQTLLDQLLAMSRVPIRTELDPARMRPSDIPVIVSDSRKLREATGWKPRIPLEKTLADILDDWRRRVQ